MKRRGSVRGRADAGTGSGPGMEQVITRSHVPNLLDDVRQAILVAEYRPNPHSVNYLHP